MNLIKRDFNCRWQSYEVIIKANLLWCKIQLISWDEANEVNQLGRNSMEGFRN
jgi:hypothetical protein